jgi:putative transposase
MARWALKAAMARRSHHVIVRGNHRRDIFRDDIDRVTYLERIEHYRERYQCRVYA